MMITDLRVGRVLRASTRDFRRMPGGRENIPAFGALVSASPPVNEGVTNGLIYDIAIEEDPLVFLTRPCGFHVQTSAKSGIMCDPQSIRS